MQIAAEVFAFDYIIQNPDRRKNKPNLLCKGNELAIFDHDLAFSFIHDIMSSGYPWNGNVLEFMKNHIFYDGLKRKKVPLGRIKEAFESVDEDRFKMYIDSIPDSWLDHNRDTVLRIQDYLITARNNSKMLFKKIREVLI
jgi:hypothetical protein